METDKELNKGGGGNSNILPAIRVYQGPWSSFEIGGEGGGAPLVARYWGGVQDTFSY